MELKLKKGEYTSNGLEKLSDMQNYVDPSWKQTGLSEYWYHKFTLNNKQVIYVLDKEFYDHKSKLHNDIKPTKIIKHENGDLSILFRIMKDCVSVLILY